jgi:hypothetical protein
LKIGRRVKYRPEDIEAFKATRLQASAGPAEAQLTELHAGE